MTIAVNTRLLIPSKLDGIGWFTFQTLKRITLSHPEHRFLFLFDRPFDRQFIFADNIIPVVIPPPTRHPVLWYIWFEWMLPAVLKRYKADVFLSPDGFVPLSLNIPVIPVIHDINFHHRPLDLPFASRIYYRHFFPKFANCASRIVTVSEFSKYDIAKSYGISKDKIEVVYNGAHEHYKPISDIEKEAIKLKYTEGYNYFIFIGSLHPRKNVDGLLRGFDLFKIQTGSSFKLMIIGERFFMNKGLENTYGQMVHRKDVIFAGRKEPNELSQLVAAAWALAFVPHFEGFGIPLLEAMECDVPSIASRVTSLPEVAGNTSIYVDPVDTLSISEGLTRMATDVQLRQQLVAHCKEQRLKFSWDITANKLFRCLGV